MAAAEPPRGVIRVIRVICGPTAAGKSALALALARAAGAEIISADSRQIYRRFDVGTAKPLPEERAQARHHGLDIVDPTERYSAGRFAADAAAWMRGAHERGRPALVVGGTGFYVRALVQPLADVPQLDAPRRAALHEILRVMGIAELRRWCERLDQSRAHLGRTQLYRAIETALLAGERISVRHDDREDATETSAVYLWVDPGAALATRIERRAGAMLASGWLDEVRELDRSVPSDAPAWKATGYSRMRDVVRGRLTLAEARELVVRGTRQYAKRQRTWLRNQLPPERVTNLDPDSDDAMEIARRWWTDNCELLTVNC